MEKKLKIGIVSTITSFITTFGVLPFVSTEVKVAGAVVALGLYGLGLFYLAPYLNKSSNNTQKAK